MKNITKIICGVVMGTIMAITCVACTNDKNVNVEETTTATESTEVETDTAEMAEDTTEETDETETETVDETETEMVEETEITQETVVDETTNVVTTTVAKKNAPKNNTTVKTTTANEDRDMGSQDKEETYVEEVNNENTTASADVSNLDYILLCNCVGQEAGSNEIATADKAKVAEVILNRVHSKYWPNTIQEVITQDRQFTGCWNYANLNDFSGKVTEDVKAAVDMALSPDYDNHGYTSFHGDGYQNYFK